MIRADRKLSFERRLAILGALAPPALAMILVVYVQSRPNTASVVLSGSFDGDRALADLKRIVSFGPRPSGSQALSRCRAFIVGELHGTGADVSEDAFTATTPIGRGWTAAVRRASRMPTATRLSAETVLPKGVGTADTLKAGAG